MVNVAPPNSTWLEAHIQFTPNLIADDSRVTRDSTAGFLRNSMAEFHTFIARVERAYRPQA